MEERVTLRERTIGDMCLVYRMGRETGDVGMLLLPACLREAEREKDCRIEPLIRFCLSGAARPGGYAHGRTMRGSPEARLTYLDQTEERDGDGRRIVTRFSGPRGTLWRHTVSWREGAEYLTVSSAVTAGEEGIGVEFLTSFTLGGLTPFAADDAPGRLNVCRVRANWSAEGYFTRERAEEMHLEPSWLSHNAVFERFGTVGSMPVRSFFPFAAVEDRLFGTVWAAVLTHASSWQMEVGRSDAGFVMDGGLADREFGHWSAFIAPGETLEAPEAVLTVMQGRAEDAAGRLTGYTADRLSPPASEEALPILFNEYCTSWGAPEYSLLMKTADAVKDLGVGIFVIDCGWYRRGDWPWWDCVGTWEADERLFPEGIDAAVRGIRERGMVPGIWFEPECVGPGSPLYGKEEWLLKRDGRVLTVGTRRFLDFRREDVRGYVRRYVIGFIRTHGFGYVKIDYNETLGIGCDGDASPGEGLRKHVLAVQDFFSEMRRALPDLVIEVCSSGGSRTVPSFMVLSAMCSFSDAHECDEIPTIAAASQRLFPPRQSQIWAVIREGMDEKRLLYRLSAGFLGRLCLSGDVLALTEADRALIRGAARLYGEAAPVIREGRSRTVSSGISSWRHPEGWQCVIRRGGDRVLVVLHTFKNAPAEVRFPVGGGGRILSSLARRGIRAFPAGDEWIVTGLEDTDGCVFLAEDVKR